MGVRCSLPRFGFTLFVAVLASSLSAGVVYAGEPLAASDLVEDEAAPPRVPRVPRHWQDLSIRLPAERFTAVAVDPGDPEVILAGADGFLFKSDDGGESWRPVLSFPRGLAVLETDAEADEERDGDERSGRLRAEARDDAEALRDRADELREDADDATDEDSSEDPDALEAAAEELEDVAEAVDMPAGDADPLLLPFPRQGPGVREIAFVAPGQRTVYVATARGLFRSVDLGERFTRIEVPGGTGANDVRDLAIDPLRPSRLYLATAVGLLISKDGAASFERASGRLGFTPVLAVEAAQVEGEAMVLVGTERGLFRSWDGADTFRELLLKGLSPFEPIVALAYDPRSHISYAGTAQGLFAGERKSAILESRALVEGHMVVSLSVDPLRPRGVAVGLLGQAVVHSEDTGITPVDLGDPLPANDALALARPADDGDALVVATDRGLFRYTRGTGISVSLDRMRELERRWAKEPTLSEAGDAALAYARVSVDAYEGMAWRARWAGLAPELRARYRYLNGRPDRETYVVLVNDPDVFDADNLEDFIDLYRDGDVERVPSRGQVHEVFVLASWDLDRIVFAPWEMRHVRLKPTLVSAEQRVIGRVRSLYTARRRLAAQIYLDGERGDAREYAARLLRLAELTSQLDALTGGFFTKAAEARGARLDEASLLKSGAALP